eukprot:TRINITY_DN29440_c0_g1_i4.p2 TRINITY_DN29440_c0_g1~~TRINITY_DN29440_c0_g1_i4.p2  ORF type:complete len:311 (-),score=27.91 TRINITY_DN29440_c0_g1_i4:621-1553(-)
MLAMGRGTLFPCCLLFVPQGALSLWVDFLEETVAKVNSLVPTEPATWGREPEQCETSPALRKLKVLFQFAVSDWLTAAPSNQPNVGNQGAFSDEEAGAIAREALAIAENGYVEKSECYVAQLAIDLFAAVLQNLALGAGYPGTPEFIGPGSPTVPWYQAINTQWPIFGLASQALRLQPADSSVMYFPGVDPCGDFLALLPKPPLVATEVFVLPSIRILEQAEELLQGGIPTGNTIARPTQRQAHGRRSSTCWIERSCAVVALMSFHRRGEAFLCLCSPFGTISLTRSDTSRRTIAPCRSGRASTWKRRWR